jgi:hypothetical protein
MRFFKVLAVVLVAAALAALGGCENLKVESPGPFPYNSRYG